MSSAETEDGPKRKQVAGAAPSSPWPVFAERGRERVQKRDAVLKVAAALFLEHGYDRASMNEIAQKLNITKPALYNYFRAKDEILLECYRLGSDQIWASIAATDESKQPGLGKVRRFIHDYASVMTRDFGLCLVRVDDRVLRPVDRAKVRGEKRRIDETLRRYLAAGVDDGSIRPCDIRFAALMIFGALNGIGQWFDAAGKLSETTLAARFADELTACLVPTARDPLRPAQICRV